MKADAVSISPTAAEMPGNKCCGAENAMPGDFLMALMGILQQQGSAQGLPAETQGGLLFQQGEALNAMPLMTVAPLEELGIQIAPPGTASAEGRCETGPGPAGGQIVANLFLPEAMPLVKGTVPVAAEIIAGPGQNANSAALVLSEDKGLDEKPAGIGGEKGLAAQVQVNAASSGGPKDIPIVLYTRNNPAPSDASGMAAPAQTGEADGTALKGGAPELTTAKNIFPANPEGTTVNALGESEKNEYRILSVTAEKNEQSLPQMTDKKPDTVNDIGTTVRLTQNSGVQAAGYARSEGDQRGGEVSAAAGAGEDTAAEVAGAAGSEGTKGNEGDPGSGKFGLQGDMQITTATQLSGINGRKLAAEIIPHVLNSLRNAEGEKGRVTVLRLKLEPESLGEIKIRLSYTKGELTAHFFTASGLVKDAVEGSLPQLRETLSQYNINLGEAGAYVGQEQQNQSGGRYAGYNSGGSTAPAEVVYPENQSNETGPGGRAAVNGESVLDLLI